MPSTTHQLLQSLTRCGLSYSEAKTIGYEEAQCLLYHLRLHDTLSWCEVESARIASLPLADPADQQRALTALQLRTRAALDKFHRKR